MIIDMNFRGMRWQLPEVAQGSEWATVAHNMYRKNSALEPLEAGQKSTLLPTSDFTFAKSFYLHDDKLVASDERLDWATTQVTGDLARRLYYVDNGLLQFLGYDEIPTNYPTPVILGHRSGVPAPFDQPLNTYNPAGGFIIIPQIRADADRDSTADGTIVRFDDLPEDEKQNYVETAFVYTYVNRYGEEGPPSSPTLTTMARADHTRITMVNIFNSDNPDIVGMRVYVLIEGSWFRIGTPDVSFPATAVTAEVPNLTLLNTPFVAGTPVTSAASFVYEFSPQSVQDELISETWDQAPDGLKHLASLDNGVLAVADDHDIYLSEPYYWHAFPELNKYTVIGTIQRIANVGGGFAVMTDRGTQFFFGHDPSGMIQSSVTFPYSITDPDSFTPFEGGGIYVCDDGVAMISASGGQIMTDGYIDRESWRDNVSIGECRTEMYEGKVVMATRHPDTGVPTGYLMNMQAGEITSFDISEEGLSAGFFRDPRNNEVNYVIDTAGLGVFNRGVKLMAQWESGDIWLPRTLIVNSLYVEAESYPVTVMVMPRGSWTRSMIVDRPRSRRMPHTGRTKVIRVRVETDKQVGRCAVATDKKGF